MEPIVIAPGFDSKATLLLASQVDAACIVIATKTEFESLENLLTSGVLMLDVPVNHPPVQMMIISPQSTVDR